MAYNITFSPDGWADYLYWQTEDKKTLKRINKLLQEFGQSRRTDIISIKAITQFLIKYEGGKIPPVAERYNELEKAERNAAYLEKLERGLAQIRAGQGIVKTMEELEAMAEDGV